MVKGNAKTVLFRLLLAVLLCSGPSALFAAERPEAQASRDPFSNLSPGSFLLPGAAADVPAVPQAVPVAQPDGVQVTLAKGLDVFFISVGQGDAEYIQLPNGKNVLIDTGPKGAKDAPAPPVADFLKAHGISKLDYLVLTHPHADHYGGMRYVLDNIQVGTFIDTRIDNSEAKEDDTLRQRVAQMGLPTRYPRAGETLDWGAGVAADVLNSCPDPMVSADYGKLSGQTVNNCSIVIRLGYQGASILFTGDAQEQVEAELVSKYGDRLRSDILKVGHHGSLYSSSAAFLAKVQPKMAYIEVGRNTYGHPTTAALSRLEAAGAAIFRTDRDGTQEYVSNGPLPNRPAAKSAAQTAFLTWP